MTKITSKLMRGERGDGAAPSVGVGVSVAVPGVEVMVGVLVADGAGNIRVIAGNGTRVVVGEGEGVSVVVGVSVGVPGTLVGLEVPVPVC